MTRGGLWLLLHGGTVLFAFGVVLFSVVVLLFAVVGEDTEVEVLCVVVDDTTVVEVVVVVVDEVEGTSGEGADSARETSSRSALTTVATPTPVLLEDSLFRLPVLTLLVSDLQTSSSGWIV